MPDPIKAPGQILQGIAEMGHLPIQYSAYRPIPIDEEIAGAVIAMHDGDALRRRRRISAEAPDRRERDRLRLECIRNEHGFPQVKLTTPARVRLDRRDNRGKAAR